MFRLFAILIGYALGNIPPGYIVGRLIGKVDVREHGSGGAGMTNVIRVVGRGPGIFVFICDILKAIAAFLLCAFMLSEDGSLFPGNIFLLAGLYGGLGAVLGHNFPAVLKFRGGKGIACSLAIMLMVDWRAALIVFGVGLILVILFRYISVASLAMLTLFPILLFVFSHSLELVLISVGLAVLAFVMHRGNLMRLAAGTENKFSLRKKK